MFILIIIIDKYLVYSYIYQKVSFIQSLKESMNAVDRNKHREKKRWCV